MLCLPFQLRGCEGRVDVFYTVNRDPRRAGFDALNLPFDLALALGFPVCRAAIVYAGTGYHAAMGWIQCITHSDLEGAPSYTSVDLFRIQQAADSPFMIFGYAPPFFDAPANPTDPDMTWTAYTFLAVCADAVKTRRVSALLGFCWGYTLRAKTVTPLPLRAASAREWNQQMPLLSAQYPGWEFESGFTTSV